MTRQQIVQYAIDAYGFLLWKPWRLRPTVGRRTFRRLAGRIAQVYAPSLRRDAVIGALLAWKVG